MSNRITDEEPKELLSREVESRVVRGRSVEYQTDFQAVLVRGRRVNHLLPLLDLCVHARPWLIVCLALGIFGGEKQKVVRVDE